MKLEQLLANIPIEIEYISPEKNTSVDIKYITTFSKDTKEDTLFICHRGFKHNAHDFIEEAYNRGTRVFMVEEDKNLHHLKDIIIIKTKDTREVVGYVAANFYNHPANELLTYGITGTNGKTTTTYLIYHLLQKNGFSPMRLSTVSYKLPDKEFSPTHTTPEALLLQKLLREGINSGAKAAVIEVSSHALALHRINGIKFNKAIFLNLTREHLDFHKTMENYFAAKLKLFLYFLKDDATCIVNIDSTWAERLISHLKKNKILTFGIDNNKKKSTPDLLAKDIKSSFFSGLSFRLLGEDFHIKKIFGLHNVYNILAAIGATLDILSLKEIKEALIDFEPPPGRLQVIKIRDFFVVIDYAHTPDALKNTLQVFSKEENINRRIVIFGCGGNRYKKKRKQMGKIASMFADYIILTSDNPRNEDPLSIIKDIEKGLKGTDEKKYKIIEDREEAIAYGLRMAKRNDLLIIAGKGHEDYQEIKDKKIKFNDKEVVLRLSGSM